jgi:CRISPR-associated endonuclease/helicase Cas3
VVSQIGGVDHVESSSRAGVSTVTVRLKLNHDTTAALELLRATMPTDGEVYPASVGDTRKLLESVLESNVSGVQPRAFRLRDAEIYPVETPRVRTGDVLILDLGHRVCTSGVITRTPTEVGSDVYEEAVWSDNAERVLRFIGARSPWESELLGKLDDLVSESQGDPDDRDIADLVVAFGDHDPRIGQYLDAGGSVPVSGTREFSYGGLDDPSTRWLVIALGPVSSVSERIRQVWTPAQDRVLLEDHNAAVAERARDLGHKLELSTELQDVIFQGGLFHDTGKCDLRFQRFSLGNADTDRHLLAKSHQHSIRRVRRGVSGGLPAGWRHEQLSVALAAVAVDQEPYGDLILRLVGTSHGLGRPGFPHTAEELLGPAARDDPALTHQARKLFDEGEWDSIIESTHQRWGVWACAYLEAVLRAADNQISIEGR